MRGLTRERAKPFAGGEHTSPGGQSVRYEGYGPGDCAVLIECRTADREHTTQRLRQAFERHGAYLGASGSVAYLFNPVGLLAFPPGSPADAVARCAWQAGAEDVICAADGTIEVLTDPPELPAVRARLTRAGFAAECSVVTERAAVKVELAGDAARELLELVEELRGLSEVRSVHTNAEVAGELLAGL